MKCRHYEPSQEYSDIASAFADRECFVFHDGPVVGTANCRFCGALFLFEQVRSMPDRDVWLYLPISSSVEEDCRAGVANIPSTIASLESRPHIEVEQPWHRSGPCTVRWVSTGKAQDSCV